MEISEKIELRKQILLALYQSWEKGEHWFSESFITKAFPLVNEIDLDRQIHYLADKNYLTIMGKFMGKYYMAFDSIKITEYGIDLVENKEDFNRLFKIEVNNISDITNSNIVIGTHNSVTNQINEIDKIIELLKKSDNPNKEEIIKVAEEYKLFPSMELFGKFVSLCADAGTVGQILFFLATQLAS